MGREDDVYVNVFWGKRKKLNMSLLVLVLVVEQRLC